jgi:hypothetical protein
LIGWEFEQAWLPGDPRLYTLGHVPGGDYMISSLSKNPAFLQNQTAINSKRNFKFAPLHLNQQ